MTNEELWRGALDRIESCARVAVLSHVRPDGDAYGSLLAMGLALEGQGKEVLMFNENGRSERYRFLPGYERIERTPAQAPQVDAVIALDTSTHERLGPTFLGWNLPVLANIDHHTSNERYGDFAIIDANAPATGEVLFGLFEKAGWGLTRDIAENLYVAIATDTGSFKYRGTTGRTFEVAASLARVGVRVPELAQACFGSFPMRRTRLLRSLFETMEFRADERIGYYSLTQAMFQDAGARGEDTEGLIEVLSSTDGIEIAISFEERADGSTKVSFRSRGAADVNRLAGEFAGGGHRMAAGATLAIPIAAAREQVLAIAERYIDALPPPMPLDRAAS